MDKNRRKFLKVAGATAILLGSKPAVNAIASGGEEGSHHSGKKRDVRWAMVIDTRKCLQHEDCHDCEHACHFNHNVPEIDGKKEEIKWIWKDKFENVFTDQHHNYTVEKLKGKPFVTLCNHCDDPPCVRVCPTQATFQLDNGIVTMDMHRCIGCRFCMAACPYGSRSFNWRDPRPNIKKQNPDYPTRMRGVVEKCNFCVERLTVGKKPYCEEACKHGAIVTGNLMDKNSAVRKLLAENHAIRRKPTLGTNPEVYYII